MIIMKKISLSIVALVVSINVNAHPGGLDAKGGHMNTSTGEYHCHREPCFSLMVKQYERKNWPHWVDDDRDCQNTRNEILLRDAENPGLNPKGCKVTYGVWRCPYTGLVFTNPKDLDIDHIVPLKEAFRSGASVWNRQEKRAFANDFENLLAVENSSNRKKGDKDPAGWMPDKWDYQCDYIKQWKYIKQKYQLAMDNEEAQAISFIERRCNN